MRRGTHHHVHIVGQGQRGPATVRRMDRIQERDECIGMLHGQQDRILDAGQSPDPPAHLPHERVYLRHRPPGLTQIHSA